MALQPTIGGVFTVTLIYASNVDFTTEKICLWDRKIEGGFPGTYFWWTALLKTLWLTERFTETKQLKTLVRNIIDPERNLGHSEYSGHKPTTIAMKHEEIRKDSASGEKEGDKCQDCA